MQETRDTITTKYREILRQKSLGFSKRNIAHSCGVSRNTVAKVVKRTAEMNFSWPLNHGMINSSLGERHFPKVKSATNRRLPDDKVMILQDTLSGSPFDDPKIEPLCQGTVQCSVIFHIFFLYIGIYRLKYLHILFLIRG